jgi:hypothetical protein
MLGLVRVFWIYPTEEQVTRTLRRDLPVGSDKTVVVQYLKDRGYRPSEYPADKEISSYHDPNDVEYQAESMITAGVPNQGPKGFFGWVQVSLAFDRTDKLLRFRTRQYFNGL